MNNESSPANANPVALAAMTRHIAAIERVVVDHSYACDSDKLLRQKLKHMAQTCDMVLDVGQSSRDFFNLFERPKIETVDINQGNPPADIIDDTCAPTRLESGPYSSIFNLHRFWKKRVEKRFGQVPARWLDRIGLRLFRRPTSKLQVSGYYAWARK